MGPSEALAWAMSADAERLPKPTNALEIFPTRAPTKETDMHTRNLIRHMLAPLAMASLLGAAPVSAQSDGAGQGRWLQMTPRTTLLHGFLDDGAGAHAFHIEAMLSATTPSAGGVYGTLDPLQDEATDAVRQKEFFLCGQYARLGDGSGKFDAVILMQLSGNGLPIVLAVGAVSGALSPEIGGDKAIAVAIDLDGDGSEPAVAVPAPLDRVSIAVASAQLNTQVARLQRARSMIREILSRAGALRRDAVDRVGTKVQRKGAFRARWSMR